MPGPITHPSSELKKNWKFMWMMNADESYFKKLNITQTGKNAGEIFSFLKDNVSKAKEKATAVIQSLKGLKLTSDSIEKTAEDLQSIFTICDPVFSMYVSQLAKSVSLPTDEVEVEEYQVGNLKYPVPTGFTMNPITVRYYDDKFDTVYNYHRMWINLCRDNENGMAYMAMSSLKPVTMKAKYVSFENNLNAAEYAMFLKAITAGNSFLTGATEKVAAAMGLPDISEAGAMMDPFLKWNSSSSYPAIFPKSVERSEATKDGNSPAEVIVTYMRVPVLSNRPKAYTGPNTFGLGASKV